MRQALLVLCSVLLLATVNASDQFEDNRSIDFSAEYSPDPPFTGPLQASGPASLGNNRPGYNQLAGPGLPPNYMSPLDQRVGFRERMQAPSVVGSGSDMMAEFQQKLLNNPLAVLLPAHGSRQPSPTLEELSATPPQRHAPVDVPDLAPQPSQQPQPQQQQQQQQQQQSQQQQPQQQQQQEQQQQLQQQQLQLQQQQQQLQQLMQQQQEQQHQLEQQQQRQPISVVEAAAPAPQGEGPVPTPGPVAPASSVSGFPPSLTFTPVPELRAPLSAPPSPAPQVSDAVAGEGQSVQGPSASAPAPAPAQSVNTEPSTLTPSAEAKSQPQSAASATPLPVVEAVHDVKRLMSESARRHHHLHRKPRKTSAYEDRPPRASSDTLDSPSDSDSSAAASPSSPAEAPVSRPEGEHPAASLPENKSIQVLETALENEMKNVAVLQSALNALKGKLEPVQKDHP